MKNVPAALIALTTIGIIISAFWVKITYFGNGKAAPFTAEVQRGSLHETVRARGDVLAQKDFDLGFTASGLVDDVYVREGQVVAPGTALMKLDTIQYEIERRRLLAERTQDEASLAKLRAGATAADIDLADAKVSAARQAQNDAALVLIDAIRSSYTATDNGIRNYTDIFFTNPRGANPSLTFQPSDAQLRTNIEADRLILEGMLTRWNFSLASLRAAADLVDLANDALANLDNASDYLNNIAFAVNGLAPSSSIFQATIDTWKTAVSTARSGVTSATATLSAAREKHRAAESALSVSERERDKTSAVARPEDIAIAEATLAMTTSAIAANEDLFRKSTLVAPSGARIMKIWLEESEQYAAGTTAISLSATGFKIQADVSELDINKLRSGDDNSVRIIFDAMPDISFGGKLASIEPREIEKEGDVYYRINVTFDATSTDAIRPGMSADLVIQSQSKQGVLLVPELAVYRKAGKSYVNIISGGKTREVEVIPGISDGERTEILSGVSLGDTITVPQQ